MGRIGGRTKREHTDGLDATLNVAPPPTPTPPYHSLHTLPTHLYAEGSGGSDRVWTPHTLCRDLSSTSRCCSPMGRWELGARRKLDRGGIHGGKGGAECRGAINRGVQLHSHTSPFRCSATKPWAGNSMQPECRSEWGARATPEHATMPR